MWNAFVDGIKSVIDLLYDFTSLIGLPSYALAITLLTVAIKLILYPLTKKQMQSMKMMQKLAPKIREIQQKYKNKNPQKMQQKLMDLYRENNVNPLAGCLPILIQMPILIGLYQALLTYEFSNVQHAHFFWIETLKDKDPFYILPLFAALTTYFQSRLTMNVEDQTQKIMLYMMPVLIGWFASIVPSGLVLYWVVFNIMGIIQQYFINKHIEAAEKGVTRQ
ncbi:MAG: YidC/Oxa1 family membrane protein insertase [Desulfotomaculum sp.]|nr:YidC/Oxa1 family membrane protein insertase [Desulfotomaculum sp.]MCL0052847.1 YidC/Oxa1 family membrane protein insertase [Peptococcaceae bacterium]